MLLTRCHSNVIRVLKKMENSNNPKDKYLNVLLLIKKNDNVSRANYSNQPRYKFSAVNYTVLAFINFFYQEFNSTHLSSFIPKTLSNSVYGIDVKVDATKTYSRDSIVSTVQHTACWPKHNL